MAYCIIFEDESILAAVKPQGMPTQPDKTGDRSFLEEMETHTGQPLGLLHRLDRPVGGVMLFAKTAQAETVLAKAIQEGRLQKSYLAVLDGTLPQERGRLEDFLRKNGRTNLSEIVPEGTKGAKRAILEYRRLAERKTGSGTLTLAEIALHTGRHHQIRVQMSGAGAPIWGDRKYHPRAAKGNIALWAYSLAGNHPKTKQPFLFRALPEGEPFSLFGEEISNL